MRTRKHTSQHTDTPVCPPGDQAVSQSLPPVRALPEKGSALTRPGRRDRGVKRGWNVRELPNGTWRATVSCPFTYVRETKVKATRDQAKIWAEGRRAELRSRKDEVVKKTRFEDLVAEYLVTVNRKSRSYHKTSVKHCLERLLAEGLTDLNAPDAVALVERVLENLKTRYGKPASPSTRNTFLRRVQTMATWAVGRDYLVKNRFLQIASEKEVKRAKAVFTLEEIGRLVDPANKDHPFFRPFCCMIYTGFRQSEMRHMQWDWFLWEPMRIALTMSADATAAQNDDDDDDDLSDAERTFITKSGRERDTRLMEELLTTMKPEGDLTGPVFPDLIDRTCDAVQYRFDRYLKFCDVPRGRRTPHSCRHTWTCLMLASGENQSLVKQYAGHADNVMQDHYAKQQDRYSRQVERAAWSRGELRLRDFSSGGKCYVAPAATVAPIAMPGR